MHIYTYDGNYNIVEHLVRIWESFSWVNFWRRTYTYDGNYNIIEWLDQNWVTQWLNGAKYTYIYDGNNNKTQELIQSWDGSTWVNSLKITYIYDGNNMIESLSQNWINSNWLNDLKVTNTYDENNNWATTLAQEWNNINWVNYSRAEFNYDENNNRIGFLRQAWNGSNWVNELMASYAYSVTGVEQLQDMVESFILSQNYPNPFNPSTKISLQSPVGSWQTLKIYDVLGNEVTTLIDEYKPAGTYEVKWDASNYPSGVYFYQLKAGDFVQTNKMILMK